MPRNIIILNGNPRPNGNTSALTAAFKRGAEEAGNKVTEFHLSRMKINLYNRVGVYPLIRQKYK